MSNYCLSHVRHSDMNTITKSAESDDKKVAMFDQLNLCTCCAENRMLRDKILRYDATISNVESLVKTIVQKQEMILRQLDKMPNFKVSDLKEEESTEAVEENPVQSDDENDSVGNGDEDVGWQTPCPCMCMSAISTPAISPATSPATSQTSSSDSEGDSFQDLMISALYNDSDTESDIN